RYYSTWKKNAAKNPRRFQKVRGLTGVFVTVSAVVETWTFRSLPTSLFMSSFVEFSLKNSS
ncbi:MAG TPA: hypothetical protein VLK78_09660, partial [Candidatus Angelobacter sp.]|nr:hypothetical protein [Candidatus Angelobacter sp.]